MDPRTHAAYHETRFTPDTDRANSQRHLSEKAVEIYAVRHPRVTTPGESRTSPTLESSFYSGDPLDEDVMKWYIPPLAEAYTNPQDAVNRGLNHTAGASGTHGPSHTMRKGPAGLGTPRRIAGAAGTNAQQTKQRQFELNPVSHPMAGGATPAHIDLRQIHESGGVPYMPMATGQLAPQDPRVTPKNNRAYKAGHHMIALDGRTFISKARTQTQRNSQKGH
jgi:hypothetical protein